MHAMISPSMIQNEFEPRGQFGIKSKKSGVKNAWYNTWPNQELDPLAKMKQVSIEASKSILNER